MDEEEIASSKPPPPFLEVLCKSSGKVRRFATGTEAGFALSVINRKRGLPVPHASYIEAVKEGEEPVSFGPNSVLVDYGDGWKLQTDAEGLENERGVQPTYKHFPPVVKPYGLHHAERSTSRSKPFNCIYFGRIFVAFISMFLIGGLFTLALENLPSLILFVTSSI